MRSLFLLRAGISCLALSSLTFLAPRDAAASGPVERYLQVLKDPTDPNALVVRFGLASEGLLFSRDGGRSFRALCSTAIDPSVKRLTVVGQPMRHSVVMDASGHLLVSTFDQMWTDDGTGCSWKELTDVQGKWVSSITLDPKTQEIIAVANVSTQDSDEEFSARAELLRRGADGVFRVIGTLRPPARNTRTYGEDLVAASDGTTLYAAFVTSSGPLDAKEIGGVASSTDGGKTWVEHALPDVLQELDLLAVDPTNPKRVLAVVRGRNGGEDALYLSSDGAVSFAPYGVVQEASGVTFTPDGRVFIGDAGNSAAGNQPGGVFTAAKLGDPLTKVPASGPTQSDDVDCIDYDPRSEKLRVCKLHRFGELDWQTGAFTELSQLEATAGLLECEGRDVKKTCEPQFNAGSSWCCTGHYPFTGFCGEWNITRAGNKPVSCGIAGREADRAAGRGPMISDANAVGTNADGSLMSVYGDEPASERASSDANATAPQAGGCAIGQPSRGELAGWLMVALGALGVRRVRRTRAKRD